jgi:hypothetical protein
MPIYLNCNRVGLFLINGGELLWNYIKYLSDTIEYFKAQLDEIKNIPIKLINLEEKRDQIVEKIFDSLSDLVKCYEQFYKPVQDFINMNPFADDTFKMSFDMPRMEYSEHSVLSLIQYHRV